MHVLCYSFPVKNLINVIVNKAIVTAATGGINAIFMVSLKAIAINMILISMAD